MVSSCLAISLVFAGTFILVASLIPESNPDLEK